MIWFKKKLPAPVTEPPEEPTQLSFEYSDPPMVRAEKIWRALGFANDRFGNIPALAGYLSMYRDWDKLPPDYYSKQTEAAPNYRGQPWAEKRNK